MRGCTMSRAGESLSTRGSAIAIALLLGAALGAPTGASASFIGIADERVISAACQEEDPVPPGLPHPCTGLGSESATAGPSGPFALFDQSVSVDNDNDSASQTSSFSSDLVEGRGSVLAVSNAGQRGFAGSNFSITFDVDAATPFSLEGEFRQMHLSGYSGNASIS